MSQFLINPLEINWKDTMLGCYNILSQMKHSDEISYKTLKLYKVASLCFTGMQSNNYKEQGFKQFTKYLHGLNWAQTCLSFSQPPHNISVEIN